MRTRSPKGFHSLEDKAKVKITKAAIQKTIDYTTKLLDIGTATSPLEEIELDIPFILINATLPLGVTATESSDSTDENPKFDVVSNAKQFVSLCQDWHDNFEWSVDSISDHILKLHQETDLT